MICVTATEKKQEEVWRLKVYEMSLSMYQVIGDVLICTRKKITSHTMLKTKIIRKVSLL